MGHGTEPAWHWLSLVAEDFSYLSDYVMVGGDVQHSAVSLCACVTAVVPIVLKALAYDERRGSCSVGEYHPSSLTPSLILSLPTPPPTRVPCERCCLLCVLVICQSI